MKAVVHTRYGPPSVLRLKEIAKPVPKDDEVLIRIDATTVNRMDCGFLKPEPFIVRFFSGLIRPKLPVLGSELAGEIEAVGTKVDRFSVGEHVFGYSEQFGAHAEYLCLPAAGLLATKPANVSVEEAAAACDGAINALTCLRFAKVQSGQRVLIYGASGAIGSAAVQLAKHFGAEVTAVCGTRHLALVTSLGADEVIDYTREDFSRSGQLYDSVIDAVGKSSFLRCKGLLKPGGVYVTTDLGVLYQNVVHVLWTARIGRKKAKIPIPRPTPNDINLLRELLAAGKLRPVIDRRYPLAEIAEAFTYVEAGHKTGNVVITVPHDHAA
jgi:NADPH:quinone reductase-like Zn-dependent oxidoreductase